MVEDTGPVCGTPSEGDPPDSESQSHPIDAFCFPEGTPDGVRVWNGTMPNTF